MSETGSATKRHNPVDSIRRKIKTIQMRGQESNPTLQIPKFQSRNFDSPQSNPKKNLEEVLKNRTVKNTEKDLLCFSSPSNEQVYFHASQISSPSLRQIPDLSSPATNVPYSVILASKEKAWPPRRSQSCSTPTLYPGHIHFNFPPAAIPGLEFKGVAPEDRKIPSSPNFYFADRKSEHIALQSPVVKRLSLSESGGLRRVVENKTEITTDVSLICEEDLLDSIFHACDKENRGKVAVSNIVDYLRHTTSRGSEDSGLDELCNMLDPEQRDISMDLDTYHAIMKEWIDDCRNNGVENKTGATTPATEESVFKLRGSLLAVRHISGSLNITSGSLEAFGGDVSKGDLETSDLITCVADLQYNNQKLQTQHTKFKSTVEALEETNHRLLEENEELCNQWKSAQQFITRARSLKDELEEMKMTLSSSEEKKAQMLAQNKQLERDNISLIHKISALQEENMRNTLETEGLRKTIHELSDKAAVLQLQLSDFENTLNKKDTSLHMKELYIEELKSSFTEYTSVIENLRAEKAKLENDLQQTQQELITNGITAPVAHKFNHSLIGGLSSLHSELELAQQFPEVSGAEWMCVSGHTSSLDVTLDREVLMLLQGPGPEQVATEFKAIIQTLQENTCDMTDLVVIYLKRIIESEMGAKDLPAKMLEIIKKDLKEKRNTWTQKLKLLDRHKDYLDKEFIRLAGNLRRMKTEQLHLRKELSCRLHDLETVKQQQEEAEERADATADRLHESGVRQEEFQKKVHELENALHTARAEAASLKGKLEEATCVQREFQAANNILTSNGQAVQQKTEEQQKTINSLQEKLFKGQLCGLLCQSCVDWDPGDDHPISTLNVGPRLVNEDKSCFCKRFGIQETSRLTRPRKTSRSSDPLCFYTPLLDALTLEILQLYPRRGVRNYTCIATRTQPKSDTSKRKDRSKAAASESALLNPNKCKLQSVGIQTDVDLCVNTTMMASLSSEENGGHTAVDISPSDTLTSHAAAGTVSSSLENTVISSELDTEGLTMEINRAAAKASPARGSEPASSQAKPNGDPTSLCEPAQVNALNLNQTMFEDTEVRSADQHELVPTAGSSSCAVTKTNPQITTFEENNTSSSEKEMETEFLRLSLGFKCDIFTLEKRLRLEERSRDLAEENLKREISSCLKLLEVLSPLCEEDNQSHEIVKKLEKSLQFLSQHTSRVASRAEMLGAIHQESRISKAVEVMIHHVENLKRMYAKEHAELEELKEVIHQNECSSSSADRDDLLKVKLLPSLNTKPASLRRVSMPAYPRSIGTGLPMLHESFGGEKLDGKIHKRSNSWKLMASKTNDNRPTLQRFISTCARADPAEEASIAEDDQNTEKPEPITGDQKRKLSLLEKNPSRMKTSSVYSKLHVWASDIKSSFSTLNKTLLISVLVMLCLAALGSFLTGLSFHRPVDGAPVGTGDSWTSLQQLLWPYTGFRHNGQPPV